MLKKWLEKRKKAKQLQIEKEEVDIRHYIEVAKFYREVVGEPLPPNMFLYLRGYNQLLDNSQLYNELYRTSLLMKKHNYTLKN